MRRYAVTEKVADIEKTIFVKEHESEHYDFDPTIFYKNCFWNRRPDGIVIFESLNIQAIRPKLESPDGHLTEMHFRHFSREFFSLGCVVCDDSC